MILDLFGSLIVDDNTLIEKVSSFGEIKWLNKTKNIKSLLINGLKVDFVNYSYKWLTKPIKEENIRLADKKDIAAIKLSTITGRGAKKDFIDLYFLFKAFSLKDMLRFYENKYQDGSVFLVMKSLVYFEDAENDTMPEMFTPVSWNTIKKTVIQYHKAYLQ